MLKREYGILKAIDDSHIIKAHELMRVGGRNLLVLEDIDGKDLSQVKSARKLDLCEILDIAIQIVQGLSVIHDHHLIHKDINPANVILFGADQRVKIIDFGISSILASESCHQQQVSIVQGTLPYMSPEQTGRLVRALDYRADFYSFGVVLYELLAGAPPFKAEDEIGYIHAHIAQSPKPLSVIDPGLPPSLANLVAKLMQKDADDRYQSSVGLLCDLRMIQHHLAVGADSDFTLGEKDIPERFTLPGRLYGREGELRALHDAYEASRGVAGSYLTLISGYSGIGKSSLVSELKTRFVQDHAFFARGKFEQIGRDVPFRAFSQIFDQLAHTMLTASPDELVEWRTQIRKALPRTGRVVADLSPPMRLVMGELAPLEDLPSGESAHRATETLLSLFRCICGFGLPIVIFFDDVQWIDLGSLSLVARLIREKLPNLLLICAYRDNEVTPGDPFMRLLSSLGADEIHTRLELKPISIEALTAMVADTLKKSASDVFDLASAVYAKAEGNPFYSGEFLRMLHTDGYLYIDRESGSWQWDKARIHAQAVTQNVLEFVVARLILFDDDIKNIFMHAACLGGSFEFRMLCHISAQPAKAVARALISCVTGGIMIPLDNAFRYLGEVDDDVLAVDPAFKVHLRFSHDRIQQAAYMMIDGSQRAPWHLAIARLMVAQSGQQDVLNLCLHYNRAYEIITDEAEKERVIALNLEGAAKARRSGAFQSALQFLKIAHKLVPPESFGRNASRDIRIYRELSELLFLNQDTQGAAQITAFLLERLDDDYAKAEVIYTRANQCMTLGDYQGCLDHGDHALRLMGVRIPRQSYRQTMALGYAIGKVLWQLRNNVPDKLKERGAISDEKLRFILRIMMEISFCAFQLGQINLALLMVLKCVFIAFKHGHSPEIPCAYMTFSAMLNLLGLRSLSASFCAFALTLAENFQESYWLSRTLLSYCNICHFWHHNHEDLPAWFDRAMAVAREAGDTFSLGILALNFGTYNLDQSLTDQHRVLTESMQIIRQTNSAAYLEDAKIRMGYIGNLMGTTLASDSLSYAGFDEEESVRFLTAHNARSTVAAYYLMKGIVTFYSGDFRAAYGYMRQCEKGQQAILGLIGEYLMVFYGYLIRAAFYDQVGFLARVKLRLYMLVSMMRMRAWYRHNPQNFSYGYRMCQCEAMRLARKPVDRVLAVYERVFAEEKRMNLLNKCEVGILFYRYLSQKRLFRIIRLSTKDLIYTLDAFAATRIKDVVLADISGYLSLGELISDKPSTSTTQNGINTTSTLNSGYAVDLSTIIKAAQSFYVETDHALMLEKLLQATLENAGAQRGVIVLAMKDHSHRLVLAGSASDQSTIIVDEPLAGNVSLPAKFVAYAMRIGRSVVSADLAAQTDFADDPFLVAHPVKSAMAVIMKYRNQVVGSIYLEHGALAGAFTDSHLVMEDLLATLAAVAIKNAELYRNLEDKVTERTYDLQAIFRHIKQGIITFSPGTLLVDGEFSSYVREILSDRGIAGADVIDLLFADSMFDADTCQGIRQILTSSDEFLLQSLESLPKEMVWNCPGGGQKYIEIDWLPIQYSSLRIRKIMVTLRDVTQLMLLQKREQDAGRAVQNALLNTSGFVPGMTIATYYQAAEFVGGDWYGCYHDPVQQRLFVFVGDVTGHGMPSALVTGAVSGAIGMWFLNLDEKRGDNGMVLFELARHINKIVLATGMHAGRMMTMALVAIDQKTGVCHYLNAGHPPIFHQKKELARVVAIRGDAMGYDDSPRFGHESFSLSAGDTIILYTDGLFEKYGDDSQALNICRMRSFIDRKNPGQLVESIGKRMQAQWAHVPPKDDCALIAIRLDHFLEDNVSNVKSA